MSLPEDPFENERKGSSFLRLTNECPEGGIVFQINDFRKTNNTRIVTRDYPDGKEEYHWEGVHFTPTPVHRTITESSAGFCTALKKIADGPVDKLFGKVLHITWVKEELGGNRSIKYWDIKEVSTDDIAGLF